MRPPLQAIVFASLSALILAGCQAETAPTAKADRPVQVQRVVFASESATRDFVGVIAARHATDLGFRVAGKITERLVNIGDFIRAGDVIARLDRQDLELQVKSAEAELSAAKSSLSQASADLERYAKLKARGHAADADIERRNAAKDEAQSRLDRADRNLDLARNQLGYAELKADADGVITATPAEPGQVVALGQPVVRLARHGEKEAVVALPETWLAGARAAEATVQLWSDGGRSFRAKLRELSPQADPTTRTYSARFSIADADDSVALGMTAIVSLTESADARVARLPLSAVFNRGNGSSVYLVDKAGVLALRPVQVASFTEDAALVTAGVDDGDQVVTLGVQKLEPGLKVRTVESR